MTNLPRVTAPRRPAEDWLEVACDLSTEGAEATREMDAAARLAQAEALVRIADHLEELIAELREHRPVALEAVLDTTHRPCDGSCGRASNHYRPGGCP